MENKKGFSLLRVKAVDEEQRVIRGMATTPRVDRVGDTVDPMGAKFQNPTPLLWMHDHELPVGQVKFGTPTKDGIPFEAKIPVIQTPAGLKARVDEAWESVKSGLIAAVSIGFSPIEWSVNEVTGGLNFLKSEIVELSLVAVPANREAAITGIKSLDKEIRAAFGTQADTAKSAKKTSGVTEKTIKTVKLAPKEAQNMTISTKIAEFQATLDAKNARLVELANKSADSGETFDAAEQEEFDTVSAEVEEVQKHIGRLKLAEKAVGASAQPITQKAGQTTDAAIAQRAPTAAARIKATEKSEPGIAMARIARCLGLANGNRHEAAEIAKSVYQNDDTVVGAFVNKAVVAAGTTTDTTWANPLVPENGGAYADFVEFLRPQTIIGKFGLNGVPALRNVPFYTRLVGQTTGGAANWVGEGKAKPVTKFDFNDTMLLPLKVAAISVATEELLRNSSPSADRLIRDGLVEAVRERLDVDFMDPAKAAVAGVSPASITNGVTPITATGTGDAADIRCDIQALWANYIANNVNPTSAVYIMSASTALALSLMLNPLGQVEFPGITMSGGTLGGVPVIVSEYMSQFSDTAGAVVALVNASDIYVGDDGGFRVDLSREATIQMDSAPTQSSSATVTATAGVSMFQTNSVAFRAERIMNWAKRRASAVSVLEGVNWGAC